MPSQPIEFLESRVLLSVAAPSIVHPDLLRLPQVQDSTTVEGITPAQIRRAYGFDRMSFANSSVRADGTGQTIAIVDAFDDPAIVSDLNVFDAQFGLSAPPSLKIVSQTGTSLLPIPDPGWDGEIATDVEWSHAIAPGANILLVECNDDATADLMAGVNYARHLAEVSVLSLSWGGSEIFSIKDVENASQLHFDSQFTTPAGHQGVTFVAAAGDNGASSGVLWPASSPNILSVGGTSLNLTDAAGDYRSETGWAGTSGGISHLEFEPSYQLGAQGSGRRTTPDVAYDGDPNTGFAVYDSIEDDDMTGWAVIGGTSVGTPQWAAFVAISDQGRAINGLSTLDGATQTLPMLYALYNAPATADYSNYTADFNDIIGNGTFHRQPVAAAVAGYDTVTGLGTPHAQIILPVLTGSVVTPASQNPSPVTGIFLASPPNSVVAGSTGILRFQLRNTSPIRFSGPLNIFVYASADGSVADATQLQTIPIALINLPGGAARPQQLKFPYPQSLLGTDEFIVALVDAPATNTSPAQVNTTTAVSIDVPTVDLSAAFKKTQPLAIKPGHSAAESIVISNVGNILATGTLNLSLYAGTGDVSVDPIVASILNRRFAIAAGRSLTVQIHFKPTADRVGGSFELTASVASTTQPPDMNSTNNFATVETTPV